MKQKNRHRGSVTLETAIVLPIFFFMFMAVIGIFRVVVAQNQMTHVLVQSTKSMALDSYLADSIKVSEMGNYKDLLSLVLSIDNNDNGKNGYFVSDEQWYTGGSADAIAKKRFIGYLTGGDTDKAQEKLKSLGIVDGMEGVKFKTEVDGENFQVTISYEIQYWFDMFEMGKIPMEQTMYCRLWKSTT